MREKWTFSNGGFRERKREVEKEFVKVEDDLGKKERSLRSKPLTAAHSRPPRASCGICWTLDFLVSSVEFPTTVLRGCLVVV